MRLIDIEAGTGKLGYHGPVPAGATTLRVRAASGVEAAWVGLVRLAEGVGLDRFIGTLRQAYARDASAMAGRRVDEEATLLGGAAVTASTGMTVTQILTPGVYHLLDYQWIMESDVVDRAGTLDVLPGPLEQDLAYTVEVVLHRGTDGPRVAAPTTWPAGAPLLVRNNTDQFNEAVWMEVREDATPADVDGFFAAVSGRQALVPDLVRSQPTGCLPLGPGESAVVTLDVPPGVYLLTTWITDYSTGTLFASQGMHRLVRIEDGSR